MMTRKSFARLAANHWRVTSSDHEITGFDPLVLLPFILAIIEAIKKSKDAKRVFRAPALIKKERLHWLARTKTSRPPCIYLDPEIHAAGKQIIGEKYSPAHAHECWVSMLQVSACCSEAELASVAGVPAA